MKSVIATVTSKGQVTLPTAIRKHLGLQQGSRIVFVVDDDGHVTLEVPKYPSVASLRGAAGSLPAPLPWAQVRATIREERAARYLPGPDRPDP
ncbi:MAG TPA: AbrB/MazE/SpoVT family DNA-binding domain-containing protein, partial [Chloroflexia bacterium]|nr:AbrB/MazE/SpoVT family DNA-binding domain-containing protein [Chloroflexia bacterium]